MQSGGQSSLDRAAAQVPESQTELEAFSVFTLSIAEKPSWLSHPSFRLKAVAPPSDHKSATCHHWSWVLRLFLFGSNSLCH
ncbi:hypothetical protein AMTR_s00066p00136150 [Amborella trichopoda]|uniref:Uncharacterized protein n=1 Tax=Amborella trichopoda TaxID=13333 RepID=U5DDB6_AMBTC|nr:hypothetical protein AMTR_s00066p00136150 [Amborella trichopoda]